MVCLEAATHRWSVWNVFLKFSQRSQENTCARVSFLINLQSESHNFTKKETLAQVSSWEFCEIFKSIFLQNTSGWLLLFVVSCSKLVIHCRNLDLKGSLFLSLIVSSWIEQSSERWGLNTTLKYLLASPLSD